jgi:hypothetical protein
MTWRHLACAFPPGKRGAVPSSVAALRASDAALVRDAAAGRSQPPEAPPTFADALAASFSAGASGGAGGAGGGASAGATPAPSPLSALRPSSVAATPATPGGGAAAADAAAADAAAEREALIGVLATNIVGCRYYEGREHTHTRTHAFTHTP